MLKVLHRTTGPPVSAISLHVTQVAGNLASASCSPSAVPAQAPDPVPRTPLVVCYGDHLDTDRDLSIDEAEGKLVEDVSPRARFKGGLDRGRARDQSDCSVHFPNKCLRRPAALSKVPFKGFIDFPESFRSEFNFGAARSASPETDLGSPPKGSSSLPLFPMQPPEQQLPDATPSRNPPPAQAPSSPTGHPRSQPAHRRVSSAPLAVGSRLFS